MEAAGYIVCCNEKDMELTFCSHPLGAEFLFQRIRIPRVLCRRITGVKREDNSKDALTHFYALPAELYVPLDLLHLQSSPQHLISSLQTIFAMQSVSLPSVQAATSVMGWHTP